jgi:hypothetical protein
LRASSGSTTDDRRNKVANDRVIMCRATRVPWRIRSRRAQTQKLIAAALRIGQTHQGVLHVSGDPSWLAG